MSPKLHIHPEPKNVTLFGNGVFVDIVEMRSYWSREGPKPNDWWCPSKKRRDTHRQVGSVKTEAEIGAT